MRRLREHAAALEQQAELPRRAPALALRLVDHDGVEQPAAAHVSDERGAQRGDRGSEERAKGKGTRSELLVDEDAQGGEGDGAAEGVSGGG